MYILFEYLQHVTKVPRRNSKKNDRRFLKVMLSGLYVVSRSQRL